MQQPPLRQSQQRQLEAQRQLRRRIGLAVLITLLVTGIGVGLSQLEWRQWLPADEMAAQPKQQGTPTNAVRVEPSQAPKREKKPEQIDQFSFYRTLPNMEVEVDVEPLPVKLAQPRRILAGTFRSQAQAQRELARLQRLGFSELEMVRFEKGGKTYYQLRTPPLDNRLRVNLLRNRLEQAGARVLVVRVVASGSSGGR